MRDISKLESTFLVFPDELGAKNKVFKSIEILLQIETFPEQFCVILKIALPD